jgi:hypothetical protein
MKKPRKPQPVRPKVVAGTLGAALSPFVIWLTAVLLFGASSDADHVQKALSAVPWPVSGLEVALLALVGGYVKTDEDAKRGWDWGGKQAGVQDGEV